MVNGLPLPMQLLDLIDEGRWRHPGDDILLHLIPHLTDPVDFLSTPEKMEFESSGLLVQYPDSWPGMHVARSSKGVVADLPWLDGEHAVLIAVNRELGADVAIALDYRSSLVDPRVVASHWTDEGHLWREVSPAFSEFVDLLKL
jgi:hypothetical protein